MNEELLIMLLKDINNENIRFGSCEVKFTFHDGRIVFYEVTSHKRRNVTTSASKDEQNYHDMRCDR